MCGILGGLWLKDYSLSTDRINESLQKLAHRGPDDRGFDRIETEGCFLFFGHTRLSIIDLSSAGHQPFISSCKRFTLIFNGEIYNYKELKQELQQLGHHFYTNSDTEVLLVSWKQWGKASLRKFVGMFAFAIYDKEERTVTCARDAFGIKPFFFSVGKNSFQFASEISPLIIIRDEKARLNWQAAYDYLIDGRYDSNKDSFIDGVEKLLPGHLISIKIDEALNIKQEKWLKLEIGKVSNLSFKQAAEELRHKFLESINLHLRSDVPLGAALSGGIDSSSVVCAIRHLNKDLPINTFSYIAKGTSLSEEVWVDKVNQFANCNPYKVIASEEDLIQDFDKMILAQGEPIGGSSIYAQYRVFQLAKENGIKVTLDGQGADEMLAGYLGYPGKRIHSLVENGEFVEAMKFLNKWSKAPGRRVPYALKTFASSILTGKVHEYSRSIGNSTPSYSWLKADLMKEAGVKFSFQKEKQQNSYRGRRVIEELESSLMVRGLPSLLRNGDRNSMAFSIESRVPFLTIELAEFLLNLPEDYLISNQGETKSVFRAAMRGIVPDEILDRKDKIGFATPEDQWFAKIPNTVEEWLSQSQDIPFINKDAIIKEFKMSMAGQKVGAKWNTWRWVNFIRWCNLTEIRS